VPDRVRTTFLPKFSRFFYVLVGDGAVPARVRTTLQMKFGAVSISYIKES
jgi:hypothetical protein